MDNQEQNSSIPGIDDELPALPVPDELTSLKAKADLMGLSYHPSIGLEKLRAKVAEAIEGEGAPNRNIGNGVGDGPMTTLLTPEDQATSSNPRLPVSAIPTQAYQATSLAKEPEVAAVKPKKFLSPKAYADQESVGPEGETVAERRLRLKRHALELIRIVINTNDPAKKEWEGEIVSAGNGLVGTVTKYIPYGADEGWHVPRIMYNVIRDKMTQTFVTVVDPSTKQKVRKGKLIKAFAIDVLDPLTPEELKELADRQAATRAIDY